MVFQLLNDEVFVGNDIPLKLYVNWDNKEVRYITTTKEGDVRGFFKSIKHPKHLGQDERYRILDYCLGDGNYHKDEIVAYNDLFLQAEFIEEVDGFTGYQLVD